MNSSVLWITSPAFPRTNTVIARIREAGLLAVCVDSIDEALRLLDQFRAGAVVHHGASGDALVECTRLVAAGSPVAAVLHEMDTADQFLGIGCAAAIADSCPGTTLTQLLRDVATGRTGIVWPGRIGLMAPA